MIAVFFALPDESTAFRAAVEAPQVRGKGVGLEVRGTIAGQPVTILHTGMGATAAKARVTSYLAQEQPAWLISAGFAGGLRPGLKLGDVVLDPRQLTSRNVVIPPGAIIGKFHTATEALEGADAKARLGEQTGADCVEMETDHLAAVAEAAGIRTVGLRAISDPVELALPVPMEHWYSLELQRPKPLALLAYLASHPGKIAPFIHFVRGLTPAKAKLSQALVALIAALP